MYFRQYSTNADTLKEWARQLNVVNKANYPLYSTVESTLSHWKNILNQSKTNSDIQNLLSCINNIVNEHIFFTEGKVMFCSHLDDLENKLQMAFDRRNEIQKEIQERNMEEER